MYLPKIQFLGGIFSAWKCEHTRPGRERATPPSSAAWWTLAQLAQARMFNIRIGSHAIKQCIFKGPKLGRKIFNFLASIPLDLAGIIDTQI